MRGYHWSSDFENENRNKWIHLNESINHIFLVEITFRPEGSVTLITF